MISESKIIHLPFNRVEGDLEITLEITDGQISRAWSKGTMFRGFERMMQGRAALDGLVITLRICGICSLTHLSAAVEALEAIAEIKPPDNARRLRNLALMAETIQSDMRQSMLMFLVDFANPESYRHHPLSLEAFNRYTPLSGTSALSAIKETKKLLGVVALIGGQWPHTSFMVPGGVTCQLNLTDALKCRSILTHFQSWFETSVLGCSIDRWLAIDSLEALNVWLDEDPAHQRGDVGFFIRFARLAGLDKIGRGYNNFISYGSHPLPSENIATGTAQRLYPSGFAQGTQIMPLDLTQIQEDVSYSWYQQEQPSIHPYQGQTTPLFDDENNARYSWVKAPRYGGIPAETGPLAEKIIGKDPLFTNLIDQLGANVLTRQLARLTRPANYLPIMHQWLNEVLKNPGAEFYRPFVEIPDGQGAGLVQAARGALGHWVTVENETIKNYQVITPTAWNGSPRDSADMPGAWEQALQGTHILNVEHPIEAGHVIRSFDPCLVCAVHTVYKGKTVGKMRLG